MLLGFLELLVGFCASVVTVAQMFTGIFVCKAILKKKSTKKISALPFIAGFLVSALMVQQARIMDHFVMKFINLFGLVLNCGYLAFYHKYSSEGNKEKMKKDLKTAVAFLLGAIGYSAVENPEYVENRYGMIVTLVIIAMAASPLLELPRLIETRSTDGLPFLMIISGFVVSSLWLLHAIIIWNKLLMIQNGITTLLCGFQLSLFYIFPHKPVKSE